MFSANPDTAVRALQNPELFRYEHFRQAALAIAVGVIIQLIIQVPVRVNLPLFKVLHADTRKIVALKFTVHLSSWVINLDRATWDDKLLGGLEFLNKSVLQVPFLLMTFMGYITPTLDEM